MPSPLLSKFPVRGRKENDEAIDAIRTAIEQFKLLVAAINFPVTAIAGAIDATVPAVIQLQDANDVLMLFGDNRCKRVQVDVDGTSTAAGAEVSADGINWGASAVVFFDRGAATVYARGAAAGTVVLALVDIDATGLTLGGDATVTLS